MCASASTQRTSKLRCCFLKRRLTNTLRRHCLADCELSLLDAPPPCFSLFVVACVTLCCTAFPACLSTALRPSVHHPSISLVVNMLYIRTFCQYLTVLYRLDQAYMYRFEVRQEINRANVRLVVSFPSLSPSHPTTPPLSRWLALPLTPHHHVSARLAPLV